MSVNQLLAKAMSTSSEEEAMNCLRMARKRGKTFEEGSSSNYKGQDARYWYHKASHYYELSKKKSESQNGISLEQSKQLLDLLDRMEAKNKRLINEKGDLEVKVKDLEAQVHTLEMKDGIKHSFFWGGLFAGVILTLIPFVIHLS